jgi:hypothetical protein
MHPATLTDYYGSDRRDVEASFVPRRVETLAALAS